MRRFFSLVVLIAALAAFLLFTQPGEEILRAFGVENPECMKSRWYNALGFNMPLCTCCAQPPELANPPQPPSR